MDSLLDLADYRRRVTAIYADVRAGGPGEPTWRQWIYAREHLFRIHPQTPLDDPESFRGLAYFDHDPSWRVVARFEPAEPTQWGEFNRIGVVHFDVRGVSSTLPLYWLNSYGGGLFLPFRDLTNDAGTYGGGRYLLDTAKGADLGNEGDSLILDFNYAYHPSCVHSDRWACPLASAESRLDYEVAAGERLS